MCLSPAATNPPKNVSAVMKLQLANVNFLTLPTPSRTHPVNKKLYIMHGIRSVVHEKSVLVILQWNLYNIYARVRWS